MVEPQVHAESLNVTQSGVTLVGRTRAQYVKADMKPESTAVEHARQLVEQLRAVLQEVPDLPVIADRMRLLALSPVWQSASYREAAPGEELLYELVVPSPNGPSLYLVSDGAGVVSPPHCHLTWAVIAGIRGRELNRCYTVRSSDERTVVAGVDVEVGPGQVLTLGADDVHSTEVRGNGPTYHLHLYGRALGELPAFESRRYTVLES